MPDQKPRIYWFLHAFCASNCSQVFNSDRKRANGLLFGMLFLNYLGVPLVPRVGLYTTSSVYGAVRVYPAVKPSVLEAGGFSFRSLTRRIRRLLRSLNSIQLFLQTGCSFGAKILIAPIYSLIIIKLVRLRKEYPEG